MSKKQKKKKIVWQQYIGMVFMMLLGAFCGILMVRYMDNSSVEQSLHIKILSLIGLFLGMYIAMLLHIIIHEAGHLVFGLLTGYKFSSFRIFSFMFVKDNEKIRLKKHSIAGTGGQCLMNPPDMKDGKIPVVLYNLGGSFMNIIASMVLLGAYFLCADNSFFSTLILLFVIVGFVVAIMNGVPMRMGTVDNDGYNAFALTRNHEAVKAFWVQMKVAEQTARGVRLKDMSADWFAVPSDESMKNSMIATCGVFACNRLMDVQEFDEADRLMKHMLEIESGMVGLYRNLLINDRIYLELIRDNRKDVIEGMLSKAQKQFMKSMKTFPSVIRTEYALAVLYENNIAKAEKIMVQFEKCAKSYPFPNDIESERELMDIVKEGKNEKDC